MELRHLRYLVAVVEEANFTRAAAKLNIAQPGLSAQIRQLEEELGQTLLDRSGRTVRPTKVGAALLPYARAALEAADGARSIVAEFTGVLRGQVSIGMVASCSFLNIARLLAEFHRKHPSVEMSLSEANSDKLIEALLNKQLDMAFVGLARPTPRGIATATIVDEPIVFAVSKNDPLAAKKNLTIIHLKERSLISLPKGTGIRTCLDDVCAVAGFQPRIAFEASNPEMLVQFARHGLGVAVLPSSTVKAHSKELIGISIHQPKLRGRVALAWKIEGAKIPAAKELILHTRRRLGLNSFNEHNE